MQYVTPEGPGLTYVIGPKTCGWTDTFEDGDVKFQQEGEGIYLYIYFNRQWNSPAKDYVE